MPRPATSPATRRKSPRKPRTPLLWPFLLSALLNAGFIGGAHWAARIYRETALPQPLETVLDVTAAPPRREMEERRRPQATPKKIAANINANDLEPEAAAYAAERSSRVAEETQGPEGFPPDRTPSPQGGRREPRQGPKDRPSLFPDAEELAKLLSPGVPLTAERAPLPDSPEGDHLDVLDPSLPRGEYTYLNTKSSKFAGFLNRTFSRVFDYFVRRAYSPSLLATLRPGDDSIAVIETLLDPSGQPLGTTLLSFSGSPALAEAARYAMEQGAWDLNPPKAAARADGNIQIVGLFRLRFVGRQTYEYSLRYGVL